MTIPNPSLVLSARKARLEREATPLRLAFTSGYRTVPNVAVAEPADRNAEGRRTYTQPQTGAVLTVGALIRLDDWEHETPELGLHTAFLETRELVEKPKRVWVCCGVCGAEWDEKR